VIAGANNSLTTSPSERHLESLGDGKVKIAEAVDDTPDTGSSSGRRVTDEQQAREAHQSDAGTVDTEAKEKALSHDRDTMKVDEFEHDMNMQQKDPLPDRKEKVAEAQVRAAMVKQNGERKPGQAKRNQRKKTKEAANL
jgi:hypothetical protein